MPDQPSASATRPPFGWLGVFAAVAAILAVPALLDQKPLPRKPFDEQAVRLLERTRPECVFLGDSMLDSRLDEAVLNTIADRRCAVQARLGTSTAVWFLMLKNVIAAQAQPPGTVVIFFRNRQLTLPAHRATGPQRARMEPMMRAEEPLVEELIAAEMRRRTPWLDRAAQAAYPVQRRRDFWRERVQAWALDIVTSSREYVAIRAAARDVFSTKNLRGDQQQDEAQEEGKIGLDEPDHEFADAVERSFLPPMLRLARDKGIRLVFFRVKKRPAATGALADESGTAPAYQAALRAYLEKAGAILIDESRDADVTLDFYGSGDHVKLAMEKTYTEMFWRKVGPLLPAPAR